MKVALATDDGRSMSQDLASAKFFLVVTLAKSRPSERELRLKPRWVASPCGTADWDRADRLSKEIADSLTDCQMVVVGRMSRKEPENVVASGKRTILTDLVQVDDVIAALAKGLFDHPPERLK